jgi:hypothetical protein
LPKNSNSRTSKLGLLWLIRSKDIGIPKSVAEVLKAHCKLLYQSLKNGFDLRSLVDHYKYTCSIEERRATASSLDRILWRFLTTQYYDYILELDGTKQRCSTAENGGVAFIVTRICGSGTCDPNTVWARVAGWVKVGRRYRGFMQALCPRCIIVFSEKTSDLV